MISQKIFNSYISSKVTNLNYEEEDKEVVDVLKSNYTTFIAFVDSIKNFIYPTRTTSNPYLQHIIINYIKNNIDNKNFILFEDLIKNINDELIYSNKKKFFSNKENAKYLNTGVSIINIEKYNVPHFEIHLGCDLIEGELNNSNIDTIKCKYRGLFLGQQTETFFSNQNKHDYKNYSVYLSKEDIDGTNKEDISVTENKPQIPENKTKVPENAVGGYNKTIKNKKFKINKTIKNKAKRNKTIKNRGKSTHKRKK
jgi:hypothetical protein